MMQVVNLVCFFGISPTEMVMHPAQTIRGFIQTQRAEFRPRDYRYLAKLDKYPAIALPFATDGADNAAEDYLFAKRKLIPEFYVGTVGIYTEAQISRKLADTSRHEYLLVRKGPDQEAPYIPGEWYLSSLRNWFLYPVRLQWKREDLKPADAINRYIAQNYIPVERVGPSVVVRRIDGDHVAK